MTRRLAPHTPSTLLRVARTVFGSEATHTIFEPLVADWQGDMRDRHTPLARLGGTVRWMAAFTVSAFVVSVALAFGWRDQTSKSGTFRTIAVFAVGGGALLLAPQTLLLRANDWRELSTALVCTLLVSAGTVALPLALGPAGVDVARSGIVEKAVARWRLSGVTLAVVVVQAASIGWLVPALARVEHDQRASRLAAPLPASAATLPLQDLLQPPRPSDPLTLSAYARRQELGNRVAWTVWPAAIAALGWRLGSRYPATRRAGVPMAASWALAFAALATPTLLTWWLIAGGPFGTPSLPVRFLPTESLLVAAALLKPRRGVAANRDHGGAAA